MFPHTFLQRFGIRFRMFPHAFPHCGFRFRVFPHAIPQLFGIFLFLSQCLGICFRMLLQYVAFLRFRMCPHAFPQRLISVSECFRMRFRSVSESVSECVRTFPQRVMRFRVPHAFPQLFGIIFLVPNVWPFVSEC